MHWSRALLQPHSGRVGAAAAMRRAGSRGDAVLLCGFHGTARPRGCSPAVCSRPARRDCERAPAGLLLLLPSEPSLQTIPLSLPFPAFPLPLIRLALHGADNTCAHPIKQAHSRRWTVCKSQARHQKKNISHAVFQRFSFLSP